jgi:hypothetical protein
VGLLPWRPAVVVVSDRGEVLLALCAGELGVGGKPLLSGGPLAGIASLDGRDLRRTCSALLLPFGTGELRLHGLPGVGEWGEWRDGAWVNLERARPTPESVVIDSDLATLALRLTAGPSGAQSRALGDLVARPWRLKSY